MFDFIEFSSYYNAAKPWMITFYAGLLLVIAIIFSALWMYRLVRDTRKLAAMKRKKVELTELLRVQDQIFGWLIGLGMIFFVWIASISKLV